jgi:hypothetical protein
VPLQDAQDPESKSEIVMEDVRADDTAGSGSDSRGPIREAKYDHRRARCCLWRTLMLVHHQGYG